jgi:hypothetical protein
VFKSFFIRCRNSVYVLIQHCWPCHSSGGLVAGLPRRRPAFEPRSGHVGFVVDKVALGQVSSEYFSFPCQFSFHRLLHIHHLSSGAGTIVHLVADVPNGLSLIPPQKTKKKKKSNILQEDNPSLNLLLKYMPRKEKLVSTLDLLINYFHKFH